MTVHIVSNVKGHSLKLPPRVFGRILHVARLHGWQAERIPNPRPQPSWETEIVLPHLGSYMPGSVSDADADDLSRALRSVVRSGDPLIQGKLFLPLLTLIELVKHGSFDVQLECPDTAPNPWPVPSSA